MSIGGRPCRVALALAGIALCAPASASAAQLVVDDDRLQCPSAAHTTIAAAVGAAQPGDTVSVCDGTYLEGAAGAGATSLTIDKALTLKGAGAGRVFVGPSGDIAEATPVLRNAAGNVISVVGADVDISGITVFGANRHVDAGIAYLNADGGVSSVEIVDLVRSGQYTGNSGVGFVAAGNEADRLRNVSLEDSLIEGYDAAGVVVDAALANGSTRPSPTFGVFALLTGNRVTGAGAGSGVAGQDGYRVLNRASTVTVENTFTDNSDAGIDVQNSGSTSQTRYNRNNIQRNRIGLRHQGAFVPCSSNPERFTTFRLDAVENWWGSPAGPSTDDIPGRGDGVSGTSGVLSGCQETQAPADATELVNYGNYMRRPGPVQAPLSRFVDAQPTVDITAPAPGTKLAPNTPIQIAATAADDIGVQSVTFLRGAQVLGEDRVAPYTATYTPTGDEVWTAQSIVAIVTDSRGQTGGDATTIGAADDTSPTIELLDPIRLENGGYDLFALADDDRGVERVSFFLDGELECADGREPFACRIKPRFVPRDRLTVVAVATDTFGHTSTAMQTIRQPRRLKPKGMSLKVDSRRMNVLADGRVRLPAGVRERDGCEGRVQVAVFRNGNQVDRKRVNLDRDCEYEARLQVRREDRHRVRARFLGNDLLRPINAPAKSVRVG
jgi:Big-like domain-containing protein